MPWTMRDAYGHTKKANTPHLQNMWSRIANERLSAGDDEASAIRQANAAVDGQKPKPRPRGERLPSGPPAAPDTSRPKPDDNPTRPIGKTARAEPEDDLAPRRPRVPNLYEEQT